MQFDNNTAFLISGILYLLVPGLVWLLLSKGKYKSTPYWCGGGMLIGVGTIWNALAQKAVPMPFFGLFAACFLTSGILLKICALRSIIGKDLSAKFFFCFIFLYVVCEVIADYEGMSVRALYFLLTHIALYGYLGFLSWLVHKQKKSPSMLWVFWGYVFVVLLLIALPVLMFLGGGADLKTSPVFGALAFISIVIVFTNHIAFMGLMLESSLSAQKLSMSAQTRLKNESFLMRSLLLSDQERVLANLSRKLVHEIRQPLTGLTSSTDLLKRAWKDGRLTEIDIGSLLARVEGCIGLVTQVVNQVTPMLKLRKLDFNNIDVESMINDSVAMLDLNRSQTVQLTTPNVSSFHIHGNRVELIQVFVNLLRNSLQACTRAGIPSQINVDVENKEGQVQITLKDNGPGFSEEALTKVGQEIFSSRAEGMGLGLWISQEIISNHGGNMAFSNDNGARVVVILPAAKENA